MTLIKDEDTSIHDVQDATPKALTSKYEEGMKSSTPRANQRSPTPQEATPIRKTSIASSMERDGCYHDALSERSAALSIKRSFDILSKMDLSVDCARHEPIEVYNGGWILYDREWSQEEKDDLVAFANKYIIRGFGNKNGKY